MYGLLHILTLFSPFLSFFPFLSLSFRQSPPPPLENVTSTILSYAVSHLHDGRGKLQKICADTVCPFNRIHTTVSVYGRQSTVSEKMTSRSAFWCAGRGPTVTHPSTRLSAKLLELGDRLVPDICHTPNAFGFYETIRYINLLIWESFLFVFKIIVWFF